MRVKAYFDQSGRHIGYTLVCPGCGGCHALPTNAPSGPNWEFNGDVDLPAFTPSLLVKGTHWPTDEELDLLKAGERITPRQWVCHSYITNGSIQFLGDSTHSLAGQTVALPAIPTTLSREEGNE